MKPLTLTIALLVLSGCVTHAADIEIPAAAQLNCARDFADQMELCQAANLELAQTYIKAYQDSQRQRNEIIWNNAMKSSGGGQSSIGRSAMPAGQSAEEAYRQQRIRDQILQHGKGGCAPDFVTGGCL